LSALKQQLLVKIYSMFQDGSLKTQLLRGSVGSIAVKTISAFLGMLLAVVFARALGPAGYGVYSFAFALVSLMAIPSQLGLPQLVIRETAKAQAHEHWGLLRGLWRWSTLAVWCFSIIVAVLAFIFIRAFGGQIDDVQHKTILVGLLLVPLVALGNLRGSALKGLRYVIIGQLPESIIRPSILLLMVCGIWLFGSHVSSVQAMGMHIIAAAVAFSAGAIMLWYARPPALTTRPKPEYQSRLWLLSALPLAMISGLHVINNQTDIIMLGVLRTPEETGIYKVVVSAGALVIFGLQSINMVVAPYFARLYSQGDLERLQKIVALSSRAILFLALPPVIIFVLFGKYLLSFLFGETYEAGEAALIILGLGQFVNASFGSVGVLLNMTGHERDSLKAVIIAAVANVLLNLTLIPLFGIVGAAIATAITLFIWNLIMWRLVYKRIGLNTLAFHFMKNRLK